MVNKRIDQFKFWCPKVLPLVYDDSLSYYEVLGKLTKKINEVINFINNELSDAIKNFLYERLNDLYVNVSYDAPTKTLKLHLDSKIFADGEHVYDASDETMTIL